VILRRSEQWAEGNLQLAIWSWQFGVYNFGAVGRRAMVNICSGLSVVLLVPLRCTVGYYCPSLRLSTDEHFSTFIKREKKCYIIFYGEGITINLEKV
jgi:hypothetical protein